MLMQRGNVTAVTQASTVS